MTRSPAGRTPARSLRLDMSVDRTDGFSVRVDAELPPDRTVVLLGPNGSGKSTTVAAAAGLVSITDGSIGLGSEVLDRPETGTFVPPEERRFGVVFQDYLLFDHLTVADNVAFGPRSLGAGRREAERVAADWLDRFDVSDLADRRPATLSGGQRQRVAMARALAVEPRVLLLDEPMAALDVETRLEVRRRLAGHLGEFAGPRLVITHEPTDAFVLADEVWIIEAGVLTQVGTPAEILRRPATPYVAAVAGTNLVTGRADDGRIELDGHFELRTADPMQGPALVSIHPRAVALHLDRPAGSPRNVWATEVSAIEPMGETCRVQLADPLPLTAEVTPSAIESLGLVPGTKVWASVKATEVHVGPWEGDPASG